MQHFPDVFGHETLFIFHGASGSARAPQVALGEIVVNRFKVLFSGGPGEMAKGGCIPLESRRTMTEGSPSEMVPLPGFQAEVPFQMDSPE